MGKTQLFLALTFLTILSPAELRRVDVPEELEASIGGMAAHYSVHLKGKTIVYEFQRRSEPMHTIIFTPTAKDWKRFNSLMKDAHIWNWQVVYRDEPNMADGIQWRLYIKQGGREKRTEGSNNYPPPEQFEKYLKAIQLLIGNNNFQ